MEIIDIVVLAVIAAIVAAAGIYVWVSRKKGRKCIGCPSSGCCDENCAGCAQKHG